MNLSNRCHEKKAEGRVETFNINLLPKRKQNEQRKKWKESQKRCRAREKALSAILNTTPQSPESLPEEAVAELPEEPPVEPLPAVVPPNVERHTPPSPEATPTRWKNQTKRMKGKLARLQRENKTLKERIETEERKTKPITRKTHRRTQNKAKRQVREKLSVPAEKKIATEKRQEVVSFLSRDENSRLLAGKKDTVGRVIKRQRRVLTKSLRDLYSDYFKDSSRKHSMSYRQFVRYRPFYITEAKATDRNTRACYQYAAPH